VDQSPGPALPPKLIGHDPAGHGQQPSDRRLGDVLGAAQSDNESFADGIVRVFGFHT
jgi:hypothetical protein